MAGRERASSPSPWSSRRVVDPAGPGAPIAAFFALQWPVVTLAGIRRFYSRGATRVPEWADRVALVVAALATVGTWLAPIEFATPAQVYAAASFGLTLYVAAAVSRLEDFATSSTLRTLRLGLVAGALVQAAGSRSRSPSSARSSAPPTPRSARC